MFIWQTLFSFHKGIFTKMHWFYGLKSKPFVPSLSAFHSEHWGEIDKTWCMRNEYVLSIYYIFSHEVIDVPFHWPMSCFFVGKIMKNESRISGWSCYVYPLTSNISFSCKFIQRVWKLTCQRSWGSPQSFWWTPWSTQYIPC